MANKIMAISYDSADAAEHAAFWSDVMDLELEAGASADFARLLPRTEGTPNWFFLRAPEGKTAKNRVYLDIVVKDIEDYGAERVPVGEGLQPAGHRADGHEGIGQERHGEKPNRAG
jgi:Glyoxalase-like domain